jgi:tetratricopeptide (TPR) repeat protein
MRYSFVADHFQYLASLGPIALAAAAAQRLGASRRRAAWVGAALLLSTLGTLTARRIPVFQGLEPLWLDTLSQNPGAYLAHYNLANLLRQRGEVDSAIRHYEAAIEVDPDLSMAHNNLAGLLALQGEIPASIEHYRRAIEIQPDYALARRNLAKLLESRGETAEAILQLREAVRFAPDDAELREELARARP